MTVARFVEVPGGRLHIVDEGSGPATTIVEFLAPLERWA
jgi:hypothetical protein